MKIHHIPGARRVRKARVAAYCRVSTRKENQEESFEIQLQHYRARILAHPDWEFAGIYADEGVSAVVAAARPQFQQMLADALAGKIDRILVKSVSRFSRNVLECVDCVRRLRARGVEVCFEQEQLRSLDDSAEMIFSMLAAIAQNESLSISQNVRWGYQKRFQSGVCRLGSHRALGYDETAAGLTPNSDAWIVRMAFALFNEGLSCRKISERIAAAGGQRLRGQGPPSESAIRALLRNELYVGDRRMQKRPPIDYLTKKPDPNAAFSSYYWPDCHEGIVDRATWERAQARLQERAKHRGQGVFDASPNAHFLYGRVFCADCGAPYKRRTFRGPAQTWRKVWGCRSRQRGACANAYVPEERLLRFLAEHLRWPWLGPEHFDAAAFRRREECILVRGETLALLPRREECIPPRRNPAKALPPKDSAADPDVHLNMLQAGRSAAWRTQNSAASHKARLNTVSASRSIALHTQYSKSDPEAHLNTVSAGHSTARHTQDSAVATEAHLSTVSAVSSVARRTQDSKSDPKEHLTPTSPNLQSL